MEAKDAHPAAPQQLGYRMPAEWAPHRATWLSWPHNPETWPGAFSPIPGVWQTLVQTLAAFEPVCILAPPGAAMAQAQAMVGDLAHVTLYPMATNDAWIRDHGPTFLVGPDSAPPALVDWRYNAWGGKYPPYDLDDAVPAQLAALLGYTCYAPGIVLEGGAVDVNGQGTLLTTEACLLHPNRNPGLSRDAVETRLTDYLGVHHILWLGEGIAGDDTDGHIDELARFVGPRTVVCMREDRASDENYLALKDNLRRLEQMTDEAGRSLTLVDLPMPRPLFFDGQRLPASYANFYIANGVVIVPQFEDPADDVVLDRLQALFPTRKICGLPARDLVWGLGTYHCITQQQPEPCAG